MASWLLAPVAANAQGVILPGGVGAATSAQTPGALAQQQLQATDSGGATPGQATASPFVTTTIPPAAVTTTALTAGMQNRLGVEALERAIPARPKPPPQPGEFEKYVQSVLGRPIPLFGEKLVTGPARGFAAPATTAVPPDYRLNPGDEIILGLSGSVEAETPLVVGNDGRIFIPHVGAVNVAGVRYGDLQSYLTRRVGEQFRNFKLSVAIGRLHGITVYVTGYAADPGAYTVSSLSTLVNAIMAAGGPNSGGSFRNIELRRNGQVVTDFDLYDLLLNGDKSHDMALQNQDVIYIGPAGPEVAIVGSVNSQAIFEAKPGETLGDMLRYAGGLTSLANQHSTYVERLTDLDKAGWEKLSLDDARAMPIERGDIMRIVSVADYARPLERQAVVVKLEGEVARPGRYYLKPGSTIGDLMREAGGLTPDAYVFGTEMDRVTVRQQQEAGFAEAIKNIQLSIEASPLHMGRGDVDPLGAAARANIASHVVDALKNEKPDGRLVLALPPNAATLPREFVLQNDDRIYVPPRPSTVGVFGAVYQAGSFAYAPARTLADYLKLAGGPDQIAAPKDIFVVRANGSVISRHQHGWSREFDKQPALPGDLIFVPIKTQGHYNWMQRLIDASTVLYQVGLGAAALAVLVNQ